ncbi:MAG: transcription termination/antitermination protein NusA [Candidatus Omnitrophota bacterium]|nr:MAG: transcription termination/antitermination protein NusA [Candidatus Omnitrophota bacterium]
MNEEILTVIDSIEREKGIPKEVLFAAIESALLSAAKKILGKHRTDITVTVDRETGRIDVKSGNKKIESGEFGRIAAQTAKQVIIQKIREAERDIIFDDYHERVGGIVTGGVHRFERGNIIVDLGKTEAVLPRSEQCPGERYKQGDRIRAYVLEVTKTNRGPQIILSRSSVEFVRKLFELEVPEIPEGIVEIKSISREPSERTKIAVYSKDEKVDPVGACVGMRGNRVKDIVRELHGEKIDIIRWSENIEEYLKAALNPAKISKIKMDKEKKSIEVIVKTDQLSIAIGKHGQNVRLASKIIGWELDIRPEEEQAKEAPRPEEVPHTTKKVQGRAGSVTKKSIDRGEEKIAAKEAMPTGGEARTIKSLDGVGKKVESVLREAGFDTVEKIANAEIENLVKLDGIGKKKAEKIIASAKEMM